MTDPAAARAPAVGVAKLAPLRSTQTAHLRYKSGRSMIAGSSSPRPPDGSDAKARRKFMRRLRRLLPTVLIVLTAGAMGAPVAWAGSPHFVSNTVQATRTDNSVTVTGKEAGLGDEEQVNILLTGTAECINKGTKHPKAANKES